jgi:hypothetical protein
MTRMTIESSEVDGTSLLFSLRAWVRDNKLSMRCILNGWH